LLDHSSSKRYSANTELHDVSPQRGQTISAINLRNMTRILNLQGCKQVLNIKKQAACLSAGRHPVVYRLPAWSRHQEKPRRAQAHTALFVAFAYKYAFLALAKTIVFFDTFLKLEPSKTIQGREINKSVDSAFLGTTN
jgi:hypothetical protein